jgi:hypothetical protein
MRSLLVEDWCRHRVHEDREIVPMLVRAAQSDDLPPRCAAPTRGSPTSSALSTIWWVSSPQSGAAPEDLNVAPPVFIEIARLTAGLSVRMPPEGHRRRR